MNVNVVRSARSSWPGVAAAIGVLIVAGATGCKMGTAGTKPAWWTFGGGSKEDAAKLAAAPSFNGGTEKPSASAKPYPTTTTPNGYVLNGSVPPAAGTVAGESVAAAAPVTYGVTPPPAKADPVAVATAPASASAAAQTGGSLASISPQVGPYAALPSEPPAAQSQLPPLQPIAAAAPAVSDASGYGYGVPPTSPPVTSPGMQRVADARGAAGWPAQQPGSDAPSAGSRYDSVTGSRFGGGGSAIDQSLLPPAAASAFPAGAMPTALEPLPAAPPAVAAPLASPLSPPPSAPATGYPSPPAAAPPVVPGSAPPTRRPDPGYRPGGTSSYRPNRAILAADPLEAEPGAVRTVGFEAPAAVGP